MMNGMQKIAYAMLGAGDVAVEKARGLVERVRTLPKEVGRKDLEAMYQDLAKRGDRAYKRIAGSRPVEQSKQATRQIKGAATSLKKVVGVEETQKTSTKTKIKQRS
jgi:hypothetical protein